MVVYISMYTLQLDLPRHIKDINMIIKSFLTAIKYSSLTKVPLKLQHIGCLSTKENNLQYCIVLLIETYFLIQFSIFLLDNVLLYY